MKVKTCKQLFSGWLFSAYHPWTSSFSDNVDVFGLFGGSSAWKEYFQSISPQMAVLYNVTDWENKEYKRHLRMSKVAFRKLKQKYGKYLQKKDTRFRKAIPSKTHLASTIHFLAHAVDFETLALLYVVGKSTVVTIVHNTVTVLYHRMVPDSTRFPTGKNLRTTMEDVETVPGEDLFDVPVRLMVQSSRSSNQSATGTATGAIKSTLLSFCWPLLMPQGDSRSSVLVGLAR